ncbi:hypothetical protein D3C86_1523030 [compost metagenome]
MPMTAFMGVRISWLMVARKVVLARLAASAWSLASRSASSRCLRSFSWFSRACSAAARCLIRVRKYTFQITKPSTSITAAALICRISVR